MSRKRLSVIPPGSKVGLLSAGGVEAVVLTVQIRAEGYVSYEVAWPSDGDRLSAWVEEFEIDAEPPRLSIGFRVCERGE